jgi:hypothetical protein
LGVVDDDVDARIVIGMFGMIGAAETDDRWIDLDRVDMGRASAGSSRTREKAFSSSFVMTVLISKRAPS